MKLLLAICAVMAVLTTSAFAQYTGEPGTGGRPDTGPVIVPQGPGAPTTIPKPPTVTYPTVIAYPMTYAAIAFSQYTGAVGHAQGFYYESEARQAALNFCGNSCQVVAVARGAHVALAVGRRNGFGYAISSASLDEAKAHALKNCRRFTRRCKIRAYASSY